MAVFNLEHMFNPRTVAVVGATERKSSIGSAIMGNLIQGGFSGELFPVNPRREKVWGKPAWSSLRDLDDGPDLVVIATPMDSVLEIIGDCNTIGAKGVVIISSGGKEIGETGRSMERRIREEADKTGLRIIGPNCLGIMSSRSRLNASFASHTPLAGKMAFISQSGAICTAILDLSIKEKIGFSYFVSLGSMLDVDFGDVIDYIGGDPGVSSIVMYVESLTRFRNFMSAARAVSRVKPIIALKAGRTQAGARAAASHTGALAGADDVYDAAFRQAGIVRVKTFEELFDCAELLSKQSRPRGSGLAILTNAGGPGVMAADALADYGLEPVPLGKETLSRLDALLPGHWSRNNPVDILGDASPERFLAAADILLDAPEVDGLLILLAPQALTDPTEVAQRIAGKLTVNSRPVLTCWLGGVDVERGRDVFNRAGITTFDTPERAVRAFVDLFRYGKNIEMLQQVPAKLPRRLEFDRQRAAGIIQGGLDGNQSTLSEIDAKALLAAYGIPVNPTEVAISASDAVSMAGRIGFPVAMKIFSPDISHKSDAHGVELGIADEPSAGRAFNRLMENARRYRPEARIHGVTLQKMLSRPDYELILGVKQDRDFGPVILFGMGGVMTEILKDRAIALPPLNRLLARRLMEQTRVCRLLEGYRNFPPADRVLLEEILIRLSQLATDFSEIKELDINPLMVSDDRILAADARVLLTPAEKQAPHHLVISPYPNEQEMHLILDDVGELFVRPIRPEDAPLLRELFAELSPQSVYFRFFSPLKTFPPNMLARFTQIDYDRQIALVAVRESGSDEKMLGVARIITERNPKHAEFAVVVGDSSHGKGIGAALLGHCLLIARDRGIEKIWGVALPDNTGMLALGRKLGFTVKRSPETNEYEMTLWLASMDRPIN